MQKADKKISSMQSRNCLLNSQTNMVEFFGPQECENSSVVSKDRKFLGTMIEWMQRTLSKEALFCGI